MIVTNALYAEIDRLTARVKELISERDADRRREVERMKMAAEWKGGKG